MLCFVYSFEICTSEFALLDAGWPPLFSLFLALERDRKRRAGLSPAIGWPSWAGVERHAIRVRPLRQLRGANRTRVFSEKQIADLELVEAWFAARRFVEIQCLIHVVSGRKAWHTGDGAWPVEAGGHVVFPEKERPLSSSSSRSIFASCCSSSPTA